ncbi:MAG: glycosyltransferase family 25 protein [Verrucomicrobia bacterium]|nr:glycosyltransferase family 25 protein [Verrucomicrobiota bacterium]
MDTIIKHFKKIDDKYEEEKFLVRNVDLIYLINLDRRPDRWKRCLEQFLPHKIRPHRVAGIIGWDLTQEVFDDIAMRPKPPMQYDKGVHFKFVPGGYPSEPFTEAAYGRPCLHKDAPAGGMGGCLTHYSNIYDGYVSGYNVIWTLEDDVTVKSDPHMISEYISRLNALAPDWDVLYTDDDDHFTAANVFTHFGGSRWMRPGRPIPESMIERKPVGADFFKIGGRTQTHSYLVSRAGMRKILDYIFREKLFVPFDTEIPCVPGINLYNLRYDVVHGRDRQYSDTWVRRI